ncbi:hypothetical protein KM043_009948 [Ampulex compressa]|nr:hypothetical protein KM043_009948 [Ampulex compressa]
MENATGRATFFKAGGSFRCRQDTRCVSLPVTRRRMNTRLEPSRVGDHLKSRQIGLLPSQEQKTSSWGGGELVPRPDDWRYTFERSNTGGASGGKAEERENFAENRTDRRSSPEYRGQWNLFLVARREVFASLIKQPAGEFRARTSSTFLRNRKESFAKRKELRG